MIYDPKKLLAVLACLTRGVTAQYKIECDGSSWSASGYSIIASKAMCGDKRYRSSGSISAYSCKCGGVNANADYQADYYKCDSDQEGNCVQGLDCKCVEEAVVASTTEKATEPPTTEAPTKMTTEPPTTEAPTKMTTEPPTSEAPAKASTKAPTDAPTKAPATSTTTTTAAPTTTTTTTSPGLALPWPKYPGRNCYWENHGAEEVDYPWGKAVANVKTLHACQAACVEAADFGCHGVLFQAATGNCYRKKDIVVEKCVRDESVDLYVRPSATVFVDRLE